MNDLKISPDQNRISPSELRKLPPDERASILEAQAALAEELYRRDLELTDFEAFAKRDLHDDGSVPEKGRGLDGQIRSFSPPLPGSPTQDRGCWL